MYSGTAGDAHILVNWISQKMKKQAVYFLLNKLHGPTIYFNQITTFWPLAIIRRYNKKLFFYIRRIQPPIFRLMRSFRLRKYGVTTNNISVNGFFDYSSTKYFTRQQTSFSGKVRRWWINFLWKCRVWFRSLLSELRDKVFFLFSRHFIFQRVYFIPMNDDWSQVHLDELPFFLTDNFLFFFFFVTCQVFHALPWGLWNPTKRWKEGACLIAMWGFLVHMKWMHSVFLFSTSCKLHKPSARKVEWESCGHKLKPIDFQKKKKKKKWSAAAFLCVFWWFFFYFLDMLSGSTF